MVTRAIIEEKYDLYKYRVRIPKYNYSKLSPMATVTSDLYIANVAVWPNCNPNFQVGDAVYIAFEDNDESKPVIIGQLGREESTEQNSAIVCETIKPVVDAILPYQTTIGDVTESEIECLKNIRCNIQFQLEILEQKIAKLEEQIK